VAFVSATDLGRARAFYGDRLGLALIEETEFACVFQTPEGTLRVTIVDEVVGVPYTVLGWVVTDIAHTVRGLLDRGVEFLRYESMDQDDLGVWRTPRGAQVAWFKDPDGNTLSITQA
jgi:catechol 2,3-dioxygenase-like lactoylglutathione lyase family enzyme